MLLSVCVCFTCGMPKTRRGQGSSIIVVCGWIKRGFEAFGGEGVQCSVPFDSALRWSPIRVWGRWDLRGIQGMLIQSLADPAMGPDCKSALSISTIYIISKFGLHQAKTLYRACSFDLVMDVTRRTVFQACILPAADFPTDSYEIMAYSVLPTRSGDNLVLTDVVGRLHSISGVGHQLTDFGPTPKQTLVLEDTHGETLSITLWNEHTAVLDRAALIQADSIEPVIIAVGSVIVGFVNGRYSCSSSSGTRLSTNPPVPEAFHLANFFGGARQPVEDLPVEFATAAAAAADAAARTRTIAELLDFYYFGGSVEAKHRCSGIIRSVESRNPWFYSACIMC